jgi:iron complex outermembrane receptor protein
LPWHALVGYTRLDYSYTSSFWLAQDLDANLKQNQTHLLDFRVGFHRDDSRWDVSFWVRNVLDEGYGVVGFDVPAVSGYVSINGPPRTLGGTIRLTY